MSVYFGTMTFWTSASAFTGVTAGQVETRFGFIADFSVLSLSERVLQTADHRAADRAGDRL
jgi:hypothetical protein